MTITGAIVLFAVIWFMCLFIILPLKVRSQDEAGDVVPGTPASAPDEPLMRKKFIWTTVATVILWAIAMAVIISGVIQISDIDFSGI
jgi:predicted secreted protein